MQIVRTLVKGVYTYGSVLDTVAVFAKFLQTPEIRELTLIGCHGGLSENYRQTVDAIISNIGEYLSVLMKTKGPRTTEGERAYRTVLAACSGENLRAERRLASAGTILKVHHRNVARAVRERGKIMEEKGSGYVAVARKIYRNKMPDKVTYYYFFHT